MNGVVNSRSLLNVSIVTYNNNAHELIALVRELARSNHIGSIFIIDNSPVPTLQSDLSYLPVLYHKTDQNIGFGAAHNIALRRSYHAEVPFHLVLNPDIGLSTSTIDRCLNALLERPDTVLLMPHVMNPDGTTQRLCTLLPSPGVLIARRLFRTLAPRRLNDKYEIAQYDYKTELDTPALSGCFMLMRTDAVAEVGYFDERYFMYMEDFDLCRRLQAIGRTICWPEASITHDHGRGSYRRTSLLLTHMRSALIYFRKWGWLCDCYRKRINARTLRNFDHK